MSKPRSIDISYVNYLKPAGPQSRNVRFQEDEKEWGFTNRGMVELPVHTLKTPHPQQTTFPSTEVDVRLKTVLEKGDWHRARNSDLRWNRASAFSVSKGQSKLFSTVRYQPNQSAYDVMLRNRSTISAEVSRRPVTAAVPSTSFEVKPRWSSNDLSGKTPRSPIRTGIPMAFRSDVTIPTAAVLSVSSAPINSSHSIHSIRYLEDSRAKRRRTRPRPKTASAANLKSVMEPPKHWTLKRLNSEYELKQAYTTVTGEKVPGTQNSGQNDASMTSFYNEEPQRVVKVRALKSAPLSSLLKRQNLPASYKISDEPEKIDQEPKQDEVVSTKITETPRHVQIVEPKGNDADRRDLKTR